MNILVAGELNVDLVLQDYSSFPALGHEVLVEGISLTLGSASAICASALAKLGDSVSFVGKIGDDRWGDLCVSWLTEAGVNCSLILKDSTVKTGITVSITSGRDRALVTYLGSIRRLRASNIRDENLQGCDHLHVSSFFLQQELRPELKSLFARAHRAGLTTSLDPGFDPTEEWGKDLLDVLHEVDVFLPNEVELEAVTGHTDPVRALRSLENGKTLTVAKLGARGCMAVYKRQTLQVPAYSVTPVDTTGAGDSFNAGFLHVWRSGRELVKAMQFAAACGALATLASGGTAGQPTASDAERFMSAATHVYQ